MLELIRSWIMGITAAAMLAALVSAFSVKGKTKRAVKLATGLFVTLAALSPFMKYRPQASGFSPEAYKKEAGDYIEAYREANSDLTVSIIESEAEAYILGKASELGKDCEVTVECREENGEILIDSVTVDSGFDFELSEIIREDLGVTKEQQKWEKSQ